MTDLCARQYDFAANKDEKDDFGIDHPVDQTREQLNTGRDVVNGEGM